MVEIQGYVLGSPTGQIQEVTVTQSGTKFYLDTQLGPSVDSIGFIKSVELTRLVELNTLILGELKKLNLHQSIITDEAIKESDIMEEK